MRDFTFYAPTEIIFGRRAEERAGQAVARYGGSRVLIIYGGQSAVKSGLLERVENALKSAHLAVKTLGGVQPNPTLSFARKGVLTALAFQADFILAIGGGSVIDTAKAVAIGAAEPSTDIWTYWQGKAPVQKALPVGCVLTISASGSESSDSAVLTDDAHHDKRGINTPFNRPRFALMNPELTFTLSPRQIACGVTDILMHTLDRYFTPMQGNELTDALAEALMRTVIHYGPRAVECPTNYQAQSELMWAGSLSHNNLTGLGAEKEFAVHQLGHELSGVYGVPHGESLSAVWKAWAMYVYKQDPARFARYACNVWRIDTVTDTDSAARQGIDATVRFFARLGMPTNLPELLGRPLSESELHDLAERCSRGGTRTVSKLKPLAKEDLLLIYTAANQPAPSSGKSPKII